jgi:uncharacterized protein YbaR (Trm112 family)/ubiquinone/menaquinone biosynthesis C-methylase UbiE
LNQDLKNILICPMCKAGPLRHEQSAHAEALGCPSCGRSYTVVNGIPDMLPEKVANDLSSKDQEWSAWSEKLGNFIQWRKTTWNGSSAADEAAAVATELKEKFVGFTGLRNAGKKMIDIGCGDGGMRRFLGTSSYYGVDPLLIEGSRYDFPMVRGVGEFLPFPDGFFDEAILNQVLDHCNSIDGVLKEAARVVGPKGTINVMQYLFAPDSLLTKIYNSLLRVYLSLKGVKTLDTKTSRLGSEGLEKIFRDRFEKVDFFDYSASQVFIRASGWKKPEGAAD